MLLICGLTGEYWIIVSALHALKLNQFQKHTKITMHKFVNGALDQKKYLAILKDNSSILHQVIY